MPSPIITSVRLSVDELFDNCIFQIELEVDNLTREPGVTATRRNRATKDKVESLGIGIIWDAARPHLLGIRFDGFPCQGRSEKDIPMTIPDETEIVIVVTNGDGSDTTVYP